MVTIPQQEETIPDVGVIVGRFQVPSLHDGHREVLNFVAERHDKVILVLGVSGTGQSTRQNPLDFDAREQMIREEYPNFTFLYIEDQAEDKYWSRFLDRLIKTHTNASQTALLYGARDSFIPHYTGKYPTQELEATNVISGTEIRKEIAHNRPKNSREWREGVVWGQYNRFPTNYVTVDFAIFSEDLTEILLGQKEFETLWRLPGGFSDAGSPSLEANVRREAKEETNLVITDPVYIASTSINDWRYVSEVDSIMTVLYACKTMYGKAVGADDLPRVKWFKVDTLDLREVTKNHRPLVAMAIKGREKLQ